MTTEIVVPTLGESVTEATVARWMKKQGEVVEIDEPIVELETDKVTLEVNAQSAGVISDIVADEGENVEVGAILGHIKAGAAASAPAKTNGAAQEESSAPAPAKADKSAAAELSPAVHKLVQQHKIDPAQITGTGKDGRILKGDVLAFVEKSTAAPTATPAAAAAPAVKAPPAPRTDDVREERVRMTRLRQRIAERLKDAQNTAAILTTFNEIDMSHVMALRARFKDDFQKKHGVKLGFMSFFVKAAIAALKEIPEVNAEIHGTDIIYKNYYDVGVAVGTENGLVVPVLRDADHMSFADIEKRIGEYGVKARDGQLSMDDLTGGTFTISNGGIYGSLLSTPILNPPQSGILGMHNIVKRAVVIDDKIEIRPMMYIALSYDHRIVDGREAVTFLLRIKQHIEDPERLLLEM